MPSPAPASPALISALSERLAAMRACLAMLERQPLTAEGRRELADLVDEGRRSEFILEAAGQSGEIALKPASTALRVLADAPARGCEPHGLAIAFDGPDACALVDETRLRQVLRAMLDDAGDRSVGGIVEAGLTVTRTAPGRLHLRAEVRDGSPIGETSASDRFDPRRDHDLARAYCGRIVAALGGTLDVSVNPGGGLTLRLDVDLDEADAVSEPAGAAPGRMAHVLVVDDNATNRMVAEALCEMFDCTSEAVEDGVEAVEAARSGRFDLILMDIKMPRMDGVAAARAIRALPGPAAGAPIIALTANVDPEDARSYLAAGMNGVVEKPIKPERLLAAMNAAMDERPAATGAAAA